MKWGQLSRKAREAGPTWVERSGAQAVRSAAKDHGRRPALARLAGPRSAQHCGFPPHARSAWGPAPGGVGRPVVRAQGDGGTEKLGLAETNGKDGKHRIWNLTPAGQKALADGNELPPRPKAGTGAKAVRAGFGPHGLAVTDTILAYADTVLRGRREYLSDWQVEVNHAIKQTGLSFNTDAVLAVPTKTSEVRLFELDNGTMSQARLAKEVWDYECYAGHRVWEGARGTIGGTYPFWQRHRYTRSTTFPRLHVVLAGKAEHLLDNRLQPLTAAVKGITIAVWANTLPRLQRGEPWCEIGVDDPHRRRDRYPEAVGR
ncbi:replication-relaxation family protein [Streptomyces sp. NPDC002033]|uniref:replication-relaxation family protein n=1 Tax=unclassified Streptomyces TaxID=2593676 RepID=UPI00331B594A